MNLNVYLQRSVLLLALLLVTTFIHAQTGYFEPLSSGQARLAATPDDSKLERSALYRLRTADLRTYLAKAPLEFRNGTPLRLAIPLPNGTVETFLMNESPILSPALAVIHPDIKTYTGKGLANPTYTIRLSLTSSGFDAIILGVENDAVYYTKTSDSPSSEVYRTFFARDAKRASAEAQPFGLKASCGALSNPINGKLAPKGQARLANNTGATLRTFRLAMAATGEFTQRKGAGNVTNAYNALVTYVNRMNAVYRVELSVAFQLVSGTNVVYPNPATDPYDNSKQSQMMDECQRNLDQVIGSANYDVGHVLGATGGSGGGIAQKGSFCNDQGKGRGVSGVGDGSFAAVFDDQLISHEVGHQFGMDHTFNSSIPVCTTCEANYSVEPGSGTTIMSYGYTCSDNTGNDDYESTYQPFLNFHTVSYQQAVEFLATVTCGTTANTNNAVPAIGQFPQNTTIPKSTPFELTATATDANAGDVLSYSWEGTNIGTITPVPSVFLDTAQPPFFRSYSPVSSGTRYYPRLEAILNGTNTARGDKLPSVGITTTHRLTVRDGVGGLTYQTMTVTIDGNSGPFLVTSNLNGSYAGSSQQTVNWDVANTTAAPVNCANVNILLSTDGGRTFSYTLAANTPNDGTESVTFPNITSNQCRLKVIAANNIFFDLSNSNFTVVDPNNQPPIAATIPNQTGTVDSPFTFTIPAFTDPENQPLTYAAVGLPASLSFNAGTRVISGTPSAVGTSNVQIVATDPGNATAASQFTVTINPPALVPLVASLAANAPSVLTTGAIILTPSASGGRPPYRFAFDYPDGSISSLPTSATITGMSAGVKTMTVVVTDNSLPAAQTVVATVNVTVTEPGATPTVKVVSNDPTAAEGRPATGQSANRVTARVARAADEEGLEDIGYIQFERSNTQGTLVVNYQILGTATNGVDYDALPTSVTFADGQSIVTEEIDPIEDSEEEGDEYIEIVLIDTPDYDPDPAQTSTRVTLKDNDTPTAPSTPSNMTVTSFTCNLSNAPALSHVDFVLGYKNGTFTPAVAPLLIIGVTGNGSLGTTYSFPFDQNNSTLTVQDAATRSVYFTWNFRQACLTNPPTSTTTTPPTPTPPSILTITSFTCNGSTAQTLNQVDFVVDYAVPTFAPVGPLLIIGVTGSGQPGVRYSFSFDQNVNNLTVQDAATRSVYFTWNFRQLCLNRALARVAEPTASWQVSVQGNPTRGPVDVLITGAQGQAVELSLQDITGRRIAVRRLQPATNSHHETFDVSDQPVGLLLLHATDNRHSQSIKILKE